ncbi:partial tRNA nuclease WapA, partial [Gammaproteobacteria bacterium]
MDRVTLTDYDGAEPASRILADAIRHLPFGPAKSLAYGNGLTLKRQHDLDYRRTAQDVGPEQAPAQSLAYAYDPAGRLQSAADLAAPARSEAYGYDALDRLLTAQGGYGSLAYTYDATGSRTADYRDGAETLYGYDLASQRLQSLAGAKTDALAHDANGNVTQAGGLEFLYAPDQRLAAVRQDGNETAHYSYDAFGRRVGKATAAGAASYNYDPEGRLLAESGPPAAYAWLDGEPLARLGYAPGGGSPDILYYHNTPTGTPHTATDATGQVVWKGGAEPFGLAAPSDAGTGTAQPLRFPGQHFDPETGLHYNMARYYAPWLGRYLQADPIGLGEELMDMYM